MIDAFDLRSRWVEHFGEPLEALGRLLDLAVGVSAHCLAVAVGRALLAARRAYARRLLDAAEAAKRRETAERQLDRE